MSIGIFVIASQTPQQIRQEEVHIILFNKTTLANKSLSIFPANQYSILQWIRLYVSSLIFFYFFILIGHKDSIR